MATSPCLQRRGWEHPGAEVIRRNGLAAYAEVIRDGASHACVRERDHTNAHVTKPVDVARQRARAGLSVKSDK